jgi:hypothetical protein
VVGQPEVIDCKAANGFTSGLPVNLQGTKAVIMRVIALVNTVV